MSRKARLPTKVEVNEDAAVDALAARLERVAIRYDRPVLENDMAIVSTPEDLSDLLPHLCNAIFTTLGTCNLEASYQRALCFELRSRGIRVTEELPLPILYGDCEIGSRRLDLLLTLPDGSQAIIELKAVLSLDSKHLKQLEYYLAHWSLDLGFLVNFPHEQGFPADHNGVFTSQILQGSVNVSDRVLKPRVRDAVAQVVKVARVQPLLPPPPPPAPAPAARAKRTLKVVAPKKATAAAAAAAAAAALAAAAAAATAATKAGGAAAAAAAAP